MKSDRLTQSNRVNARKSTGPRSVTGKQAVSLNALSTGMYATSLIILGENPADFELLQKENYDFHLPMTPEERFHLDVMIRSEWQMRRLSNVESQVWSYRVQQTINDTSEDVVLGQVYCSADTVFARLERQKTTVYHTYKEAAAELAALQAARYEFEHAEEVAPAIASQSPEFPVDPNPPSAHTPAPLPNDPNPPSSDTPPPVPAVILPLALEQVSFTPPVSHSPETTSHPIGFVPSNSPEPPALSVAPVGMANTPLPPIPSAPSGSKLMTQDPELKPQIGFVPSDIPVASAELSPAVPAAGLPPLLENARGRVRYLTALREERLRRKSASRACPSPVKTAS